ncbi:c-type cytochrome [Sinorhizobium garamanticum]|uniref:C-type cytochrome n=1 Tax=Sinorhizobium garamanticum TaxID=680247 RepID=A0ABY8DHZ7_9HYPH|nr:c-type cytochrome [Sinorhizobium garamanticum]WEX89622.1 c-type cytochrome [Sinorhizobium garamanticum]
MRFAITAAAFLVSAVADGSAQEARDPGERAFLQCYSCHSVEAGETEGLQGPNLAGIVGRPIAAQPGFEYSPAMRAFAREYGSWSAALLDRFIADPEQVIPGTAMSGYPGLADNQARRALMEFLKSH